MLACGRCGSGTGRRRHRNLAHVRGRGGRGRGLRDGAQVRVHLPHGFGPAGSFGLALDEPHALGCVFRGDRRGIFKFRRRDLCHCLLRKRQRAGIDRRCRRQRAGGVGRAALRCGNGRRGGVCRAQDDLSALDLDMRDLDFVAFGIADGDGIAVVADDLADEGRHAAGFDGHIRTHHLLAEHRLGQGCGDVACRARGLWLRPPAQSVVDFFLCRAVATCAGDETVELRAGWGTHRDGRAFGGGGELRQFAEIVGHRVDHRARRSGGRGGYGRRGGVVPGNGGGRFINPLGRFCQGGGRLSPRPGRGFFLIVLSATVEPAGHSAGQTAAECAKQKIPERAFGQADVEPACRLRSVAGRNGFGGLLDAFLKARRDGRAENAPKGALRCEAFKALADDLTRSRTTEGGDRRRQKCGHALGRRNGQGEGFLRAFARGKRLAVIGRTGFQKGFPVRSDGPRSFLYDASAGFCRCAGTLKPADTGGNGRVPGQDRGGNDWREGAQHIGCQHGVAA